MDLVTLQPNFGLQNRLSQIWSLWALQHWGCGLTTLSRIFRSAHVGRCTIKLLPQQQHFSVPALCDQSHRGVQHGEWKWGACVKPLLSLLHQTAPAHPYGPQRRRDIPQWRGDRSMAHVSFAIQRAKMGVKKAVPGLTWTSHPLKTLQHFQKSWLKSRASLLAPRRQGLQIRHHLSSLTLLLGEFYIN